MASTYDFSFTNKFFHNGKGSLSLSQRVGNNEKKITALKNIIKAPKAIGPGFRDLGKKDDVIQSINNKLGVIIGILSADLKREKVLSAEERRGRENLRRLKTEEDQEEKVQKALTNIKKIAETALSPLKNIFNRILRFAGFTALGFLFNNLYKWWTNPENIKKINLLGRFLKDWWPALSGAALLFLTPFGLFIRTTLKFLRSKLPQLLRLVRLSGRGSIPRFATGGMITPTTGTPISGTGVDTRLIAAQPGEMVIPKNTVNTFGDDFFMNLIKSSGSTGIPKLSNNLQLMNQGGSVLSQSPIGQVVDSLESSSGMWRGASSFQLPALRPANLANLINNFKPAQSSVRSPLPSKSPVISASPRFGPVSAPPVSSETQMIVLPPITTVAKQNDNTPTLGESDIPQFNIIASGGERARITAALGIGDLVGE